MPPGLMPAACWSLNACFETLMKLTPFLIDKFAQFILGGKAWGRLQAIVIIVENPDISGAEKRQQALAMIEKIGIDLAGFLLNLGLELAVAKLRSRYGTEPV